MYEYSKVGGARFCSCCLLIWMMMLVQHYLDEGGGLDDKMTHHARGPVHVRV